LRLTGGKAGHFSSDPKQAMTAAKSCRANGLPGGPGGRVSAPAPNSGAARAELACFIVLMNVLHLRLRVFCHTQFMLNQADSVLKLTDLFHVSGWQHRIPWKPFKPSVEIYRLYGDGVTGPTAVLLRFQPGGRVALHEHIGYEHIIVLAGSQVDENSRTEAGTLIINPPGTSHSVLSETGCIVLAIYEQPVKFPTRVLLAVNGTLMRGLELNSNLLAVGATFVREIRTAPAYRIWSINDRHPAMMRAESGGVAVDLEVWAVPPEGLSAILLAEPPGLCVGKIKLEDGSEVLGVLGEAMLCENQAEITQFGGWRAYLLEKNTEGHRQK